MSIHRIPLAFAFCALVGIVIASLLWPRLGPAGAASVVPPNDNFPGTPIAFLPYSDGPLNTAKATTEMGEQSPCGGIGKTVWYTYAPSATTVVQADTISSDYNTVIVVYTGPNLPSLNSLACNDDFFGGQSKVQFTATVGVTYHIQVGGFNGASGNLVFHLAPPPPPPKPPANDNLSGGTDASNGGFSDQVYTGTATNESLEASPCGGISRTVWYHFAPAQSYPVVEVKTFDPDLPKSSDFDTVIAVYSGPPPPATFPLSQLVPPVCNDNAPGHGKLSLVQFPATAGVHYYIQVGGFNGSVGNLHFSLTIPPPPTDTPTSTATDTPTNTPTAKVPPTFEPSPTPNPSANGSLRLDADCNGATTEPFGTHLADGSQFTVCVFAQFPSPGSAAGYQVDIHWDDPLLNLYPRTAPENEKWHLVLPPDCGPPNAAGVSQSTGAGFVRLSAQDSQDQNATCVFEGKVAEFMFSCKSHGSTNMVMRNPGVDSYFTNGVTPVKPTLGSVQIRCVTAEVDSDLDGCTNQRELGAKSTANQGGGRNPLNFWDFFDVWTHPFGMPLAWERTKTVNLNDIFAIAKRFAATGNPNGDQLSLPINDNGYHTDYDRTFVGPNPLNLGPPDGAIGLAEINWAANQFGANCN